MRGRNHEMTIGVREQVPKIERRCNRNLFKKLFIQDYHFYRTDHFPGKKSSTVFAHREVHGKYPYRPTTHHFSKSQNITHQPSSMHWIMYMINFLTQSKKLRVSSNLISS
jgi:hypothetical protein